MLRIYLKLYYETMLRIYLKTILLNKVKQTMEIMKDSGEIDYI